MKMKEVEGNSHFKTGNEKVIKTMILALSPLIFEKNHYKKILFSNFGPPSKITLFWETVVMASPRHDLT